MQGDVDSTADYFVLHLIEGSNCQIVVCQVIVVANITTLTVPAIKTTARL